MHKFSIVFIILILFSQCRKETFRSSASGSRGQLISYKKVATMTTNDILNINAEENESDIWKTFLNHSVDLYSVVYNSLYKGQLTELSGLVLIPHTTDSISLLQYHHGTMIPIPSSDGEGINDAPSLFKGEPLKKNADFYETRLLCLTMASNGYVLSAPDYAGYNVTKHLNHPYTLHKELAASSVDMLRASTHLIKQLNLKYNGKVFLTGWSEGGGAALATQKYIESFIPSEFDLIANAPFAGAYDYDTFAFDVFNKRQRAWPELSIYSWAGHVWNEFGNINRPSDQIWNYPVNSPIEALNLPSNTPVKVFRLFFMDNILNGNDTKMLSVIKENDLIDNWTPKTKLFFHHGINDNIVPFYNAENAHNAFVSLGVNSHLYAYQGNHYTPVFDYLNNVLTDFNNLKK